MFGKYRKVLAVDSLPNNNEKIFATDIEGMIPRSIQLYTTYKEGNTIYCIDENYPGLQIYFHEGNIKIRTEKDLSMYSGSIIIVYDKESECAI